jgi:hypothetical protein
MKDGQRFNEEEEEKVAKYVLFAFFLQGIIDIVCIQCKA